MFYIDRNVGEKVWKYPLVDEVLAAASAGMSATTGLDERCIIFTIHLTHAAGHLPLCQTLFDKVESHFIANGIKRRSASYSGLASFIDVNGSKFSGADRDYSQAHCHGFIFIPWNTSLEDAQRLIESLKFAVRHLCHEGQLVVRSNPDSIEIRAFDRMRKDAGLGIWTEYAQKEAMRVATEGDMTVMLPFDTRKVYGEKVSNQIDRKQQKTLATLRSKERFKILRC